MDNAVFRITDGTDYIDLIGSNSAFQIKDWKPVMSNPKGGGLWSDSPFTHGRQLVQRLYENIVDNLVLTVRTGDQDHTIAEGHKLRGLLQKATDYWVTSWATTPVWIEARGSAETEIRYSLIKDWRAPGDNNPFMTPFFACPSVMDEFALLIEHDFWTENEPGGKTCVQISAQGSNNYPYCISFSGGTATENVDCLSAAAVDNLPTGAGGLTVEAWVRADTYGGGNSGRIMDKGAEVTNFGWWFYISSTTGLSAKINAATTPAISTSGLDEFTADGRWHHVAMTYNNGGDRKIRLFIDGIQVTSYPTQQAASGLYSADAAYDLGIGNNISTLANCWGGLIGWCRISNNVRYSVSFTPPSRCVMPVPDGNTVGIWIGEGTGTTVYNKVGTAGTNGSFGGAPGPVWASECDLVLGREAVCATIGDADTAYVSNQFGGQISHLFYLDASGPSYSVNLLGSTPPYNLFPPVMQAAGGGSQDMLYIGSDTTGLSGGPFNSVVFNIGTAANTIVAVAWEYWNGAWVALSASVSPYPTSSLLFMALGVMIVYFAPPSDWAVTTVNGCTGYMIRCRLLTVGGGATSPQQSTRQVYSINTPYLEIADTQIAGDLPALAELLLNKSEFTANKPGRALLGWRSVARGDQFSAYINVSDRNNPPGVTVASSPGFSTSPLAPAGRYDRYNPGAVAPLADEITITFAHSVVDQYYGRFRLFVRTIQTGGVAGDFSARFALTVNGSTVYGETKQILDLGTTSTPCVTDLGTIDIASGELEAIGVNTLVSLVIQYANSNVAPGTLDSYDVILLPCDELPIEVVSMLSYNVNAYLLDIDSIVNPKKLIDVSVRYPSTLYIEKKWKAITGSPFVAPVGTQSRLWISLQSPVAYPAQIYRSYLGFLEGAFLEKQQRYFIERGAV